MRRTTASDFKTPEQLSTALNMVLGTNIAFDRMPLEDLQKLFTLVYENTGDLVIRITKNRAMERFENVVQHVDAIQQEMQPVADVAAKLKKIWNDIKTPVLQESRPDPSTADTKTDSS